MACKVVCPASQQLIAQSMGYDYVRFTYADFHGQARSQVVPRRHFESALKDGGPGLFSGLYATGPRTEINLEMPGLPETKYGNAYMVPEVEMIFDLPWAGGDTYRVGEVLCETRWEDGTHQSMCPRTIARKQLDRLHRAGYNLMSATEVEFTLCSDQDKTKPAFDGCDIFCNLLFSEYEKVFFDVDTQLISSGIDVTKINTEYGPGQIEFALHTQMGIESFDTLFRSKEAIKELFQKRGYTATFMTKPFPECSANGFHMNHSLWRVDTGANALFDATCQHNLSDVGLHWLAGLIKHAPALTAISNPTVNCYRRLHHPWSPDKPDWGWDSRMSSFRVKSSNPSRTYIENRLPSSASNPYLVAAATVAAGLDGLENDLPCPPVGSEGLKDLPHTLEESLEELQADQVITQALGKELMDYYIPIKKEFEIEKFKRHDFKEDNADVELKAERTSYYKFL